MIKIAESAEYEVGMEMSKIGGQLRQIKKELDEPDLMDAKDMQDRLDSVLNMLNRVHNWMIEQ